MKKHVLVFLALLWGYGGYAQPEERIAVTTILPDANTGLNYTPWLNDNIASMVAPAASPVNQYTDVTLLLEQKASISHLSFYCTDSLTGNPAYIYVLQGNTRSFIGCYNGQSPNSWVQLTLSQAVPADGIVVRKYGNNIPQKIQVFGTPLSPVQPLHRLPLTSVTASAYTSQDYSSLLSDDIGNLVPNAWQDNFKYVDLKFPLQQKAMVRKLSLYDYEGVFDNEPAYIYGATAAGRVLIDSFTGPGYMSWYHILPAQAVVADTIVVRKYCNNLPQKIIVQGDYLPVFQAGKIPLDAQRWYQLNNTSSGLEGLTNGITNEVLNTGWGKALTNFDAYYPLKPDEEINIDSIKLYDGQGSNESEPVTISVIDSNWNRTVIATFIGNDYMQWVGPYPYRTYTAGMNRFKLDSTIKNPRYLVLNTSGAYPTEIELYGTYKAATAPTSYVQQHVKLGNAFGVNGYEWNFEEAGAPYEVNEDRAKVAKCFTGFRHYMDWERLEETEGGYTFNPCHSGGWNYDAIYERCNAEGIEVLACLKTLPGWMQNTYPEGARDAEYVPVRYGKDFSDPQSYIEQAKMAFQYAARYGNNAAVDSGLLHVNSTPRWTNDDINVVRRGLGLVHYIECDNERDKWWKGRAGYQTGREYAANLSAFYDGNKNTMGPGVGVKNADPTMQVVMAGLAGPNTDYVRGMIDWCRQYRGYKPDGSVNLCWDVINYHEYCNDLGISQNANANRGVAPELSVATANAQKFLQVAHEYAGDMPIWITETGYDINQGSPQRAIAIGNKTVLQTQADWILRTSLLYTRLGMERVFFYQMYDDNDGPGQFGTSGLANANKTRRPAADFLLQANKLLGAYHYSQTLNSSPVVDKYELNGRLAYVLTMPTENGSTGSYQLAISNTDSVRLYTPQAGQDSMSMVKLAVVNGMVSIPVTETPVFVLPGNNANTARKANAAQAIQAAQTRLRMFPNPTSGYITIELQGASTAPVSVAIYNTAGQLVYSRTIDKQQELLAVQTDVSGLAGGIYLVKLLQDGQQWQQQFIKTNN